MFLYRKMTTSIYNRVSGFSTNKNSETAFPRAPNSLQLPSGWSPPGSVPVAFPQLGPIFWGNHCFFYILVFEHTTPMLK